MDVPLVSFKKPSGNTVIPEARDLYLLGQYRVRL
jgi:hypothetical protein